MVAEAPAKSKTVEEILDEALKKSAEIKPAAEALATSSGGAIRSAEKLARTARDSTSLIQAVVLPKDPAQGAGKEDEGRQVDLTAKFKALQSATRKPG